MPVALAIGGAALVGAAATSSAAKKNAKAVTTAADNSNATQLQIYNQNRGIMQPFVDGGTKSFDAWQSMMGLKPGDGGAGYGAFKASTGYQDGLDQGNRASTARLAASGMIGSGAAVKEAARYNQSYANSFAGDYLSRLMQGTQVGAGSANALAGVGTNYANAVSNTNTATANALTGANNAQASALTGLANNAAGAFAYGSGDNWGRNSTLASSYGKPAVSALTPPSNPFWSR